MALNLGSLDVFDQIYRDNVWGDGKGSGIGSDANHVRPYTRFLQQFLLRKGIRSIVDLGCGDWQFSCELDLSGITYYGVDVASTVIESNRQRFEAANIKFHQLQSYEALPKADLLICKDVLMHLGRDEVNRIIQTAFPKYRFILITSDVQPYSKLGDAYLEARKIRQGMFNEDILTGQMTPFDIRLPPYNLSAETVFSWTLPFNGMAQRLQVAHDSSQGVSGESRVNRLIKYPLRFAQAALLRDCVWRKDCTLISQTQP